MKSQGAICVTLRRTDGQFWTRVRIGLRHWQSLEVRAKEADTTVLGLLLDQAPRGREA